MCVQITIHFNSIIYSCYCKAVWFFSMEHNMFWFSKSLVFYTFHTHLFMMYNLLKSMLNDCNDKMGKETIKWVHMALILYFKSHGRFVWRQHWKFFSFICHHPLGLNDAGCHLLLYPIHFHYMEKSMVNILSNIYIFWNNTRISKWWQDNFFFGGGGQTIPLKPFALCCWQCTVTDNTFKRKKQGQQCVWIFLRAHIKVRSVKFWIICASICNQ